MDAKDLRLETALGAHTNDGSSKYTQSGSALQANGNKPYLDIGSNSLAKVDVPTARPCAIIGPDRVVPPLATNDVYLKKVSVELWPCPDNLYQHPPEYPHKPGDYPPPRNISPRQTFQENMQRIMVPPTYASVRNNEDRTLKNSKLMPPEAKYCDVPYTISPINNEPKIVKSSEGLVLNNNPNYTQPLPHQGWSGNGINVRPLRPYGAPELYQFSEYPNCPGPRPISMIRPHRNVHEDMPQVYQERFYPEASIRFKPYPTTKERPHQLPQARYDYLANYPNSLHLHSPYSTQKYDIQKSMPPHPCPVYPPVPLKYLDRRMTVPTMERYQRSPNQQVNLNPPYCNQNIPPTYSSVSGNCLQNRAYPYSPDPSTKPILQNRFYFDSHNARKYYPNSEHMYINDITPPQTMNNDVLYQPYPPINIHSISPHHMFRKDNSVKGYEHATHFKNIEYHASMNSLSRLPLQFSPQTISVSPDSNTSNDTMQALNNIQEDCGYVSQSSTASVKSTESGVNRIPNDMYRRQYMRYETRPHINKPAQKSDTKTSSKDKKGLDVRQFLQMWNEGDEGNDNNKETCIQKDSNDPVNQVNHYSTDKNQEQLYVLGLVNVPNEELCKYDHIQKISKLPENIKGYNNIELLNQYEKLVETPGMNHFSLTPPAKQKDLHVPVRNIMPRQGVEVQPRPISPLDVEAKISQSVIHKEVGCNFEIRPCSPQMLNVEVATPVHNLLGERLIEKVVNPIITKSPMVHRMEEADNETSSRNSPNVQSCKMINNQYPSPNLNDTLKSNYCLQDLETNSGLCLASLPRLDNDIELNFPEINQQFINANKIEPVKTLIRDLPVLDTDNNSNGNKSGNTILNKPYISDHLHSGSESDKEVSKLSKYRKQKKSSSIVELNDTGFNSKQPISLHRTDSVIIKNPENAKSQEEYVNLPSSNHLPSNGETTFSINIHVDGVNAVNTNSDSDKNLNKTISTTPDIADTAIDFSLNKNDEQSSINVPLQNSTNADKNIILNSENISNNSDKFITINSPEEYEKNSTSSEFTNSLILDHSNYPETLNLENNINTDKEVLEDNLNFESINGGSLIEETLKTHSKPKESPTDMTSAGSLSRENIIQPNESTISSHNAENAPIDIKSFGKDGNLINTDDISNNIDNEIQNKNLTYDLNATLQEPINANLVIPKEIDLSPISDCIENDCPTANKSKNTTENISINEISIENEFVFNSLHVSDETNNIKSCDPKNLQELLIDKVEKVENVFEVRTEIKTDTMKTENELDMPKNTSEDNNCALDTDLTFKSNNENPEFNNFNNSFEGDVINDNANICLDNIKQDFPKPKPTVENNVNDIKINTKYVFESGCTPYTENAESDKVYNTELDSLENAESDTSNNAEFDTLNNPIYNTDENMGHTMSFERKKSFLKKELFSPQIQNLLVHNVGFCTILNNYEEKNISTKSHYTSDNITSPYVEKNIVKNSERSLAKSDIYDKESKDNTNAYIKNNDSTETVDEIPLAESNTFHEDPKNFINSSTVSKSTYKIESALNTVTSGQNKDLINSDLDVNRTDADNVENNNMPIEDVRDSVNLETHIVVENNETDLFSTEVELADEPFSPELIDNIEKKDSENPNETPFLEEHFPRHQFSSRHSRTLKRSLSESAATEYANSVYLCKDNYGTKYMHTNKRAKIDDTEILLDSNIITENFSRYIQNNRRNSISTIYNDENVSFCIVIDNDCVITEENDCQKICYTEIPSECLATICSEDNNENSESTDVISCEGTEHCEYGNEFILQNVEDKTVSESWVEDVACIETVFSDDIAEDIVISAPSSPKSLESSEYENENTESIYNVNTNEHTNKLKYIYGNQMSDYNVQLVEKLYRTPQMDVNKTLINGESQLSDEYNRYYDDDSLEKILSESNTIYNTYSSAQSDTGADMSTLLLQSKDYNNHENEKITNEPPEEETHLSDVPKNTEEKKLNDRHCLVHSCESSSDNLATYSKDEEKMHYAISSSPEVSSTTSEDKGSAILLKIRSYKGTKISEINEMGTSFNHSNPQIFNKTDYNASTPRPLITKAAQKYIPPLKETLRDLKVKLRLPKQSLYKLQQLKKSKEEPKIKTNCNKNNVKTLPHDSLKKSKPKPKFEDVLKSIDEIQFQMHKEKNKKAKQSIPKVIIKKNENGAHYASTQSKETFNPDLTGRKWQPWVFLEKSKFIDNMALKKKFKAIYSHRKKMYVLAERFRKYKAISNSKFVITHPKQSESLPTGKLKYTFKLKHN